MPLYFITGAPGSGKTTITHEMGTRGYTVYDTDDPEITGMAGWHNLATGEYTAGFNQLKVTEELLATHIWRLTDRALGDFRQRSRNELIYLCGRLRDANSVIEASKKVIFLTVSAPTIQKRLARRAMDSGAVEWGVEQWQIDKSIVVNEALENEYRELGAIMIDAEKATTNVVDDIIGATRE